MCNQLILSLFFQYFVATMIFTPVPRSICTHCHLLVRIKSTVLVRDSSIMAGVAFDGAIKCFSFLKLLPTATLYGAFFSNEVIER